MMGTFLGYRMMETKSRFYIFPPKNRINCVPGESYIFKLFRRKNVLKYFNHWRLSWQLMLMLLFFRFLQISALNLFLFRKSRNRFMAGSDEAITSAWVLSFRFFLSQLSIATASPHFRIFTRSDSFNPKGWIRKLMFCLGVQRFVAEQQASIT